jgi:Skp family chaperone for outer membrane proteins
MKKGLFTTLLLVFSVVSFFQAQAQEKPFKPALVNTAQLLAAHPDGQKAAALRQQATDELAPLLEQIKALQTKSQSAELTAEERSQANLLVATVEQTKARYEADVRAAAQPAQAAIDAAIKAVAAANGYTLVIDGDLAGANGLSLFVYVDLTSIPDITQQVITQMNGQ